MQNRSPLALALLAAWFAFSIVLAPAPAHAKEEEKGKKKEKKVEYRYMEDGTADLGKYTVKIFNPEIRKTLHVDFELLGTVQFEDQEKFMDFMNRHYYQLRDLVNTTVKTCTSDQLTDPTHHTFNRKITARVNRALGWKFLKSVEPINYRLVQWSVDEGMVLIPLRPMPQKVEE